MAQPADTKPFTVIVPRVADNERRGTAATAASATSAASTVTTPARISAQLSDQVSRHPSLKLQAASVPVAYDACVTRRDADHLTVRNCCCSLLPTLPAQTEPERASHEGRSITVLTLL
jgi:hypothetical protein